MSGKQKAIYLEWVDSMSSGEPWGPARDAGRDIAMRCQSLALFVEETDRSVTIANSLHPMSGTVAGIMTIPKCAITKRRWVKLP